MASRHRRLLLSHSRTARHRPPDGERPVAGSGACSGVAAAGERHHYSSAGLQCLFYHGRVSYAVAVAPMANASDGRGALQSCRAFPWQPAEVRCQGGAATVAPLVRVRQRLPAIDGMAHRRAGLLFVRGSESAEGRRRSRQQHPRAAMAGRPTPGRHVRRARFATSGDCRQITHARWQRGTSSQGWLGGAATRWGGYAARLHMGLARRRAASRHKHPCRKRTRSTRPTP